MKQHIAIGASMLALLITSSAFAQNTDVNYYGRTMLMPKKPPEPLFVFETGDWSPWSSTCSDTALRTRTVVCKSEDDAIVPDANCKMHVRPLAVDTGPNLVGCSHTWEIGNWGPPSSLCSATSIETRPVICRRSDGKAVEDASCTSTKPTGSQVSANYSQCTYDWVPSQWTDWSSNCSATAERTRTVTCMRMETGTPMVASQCSNEDRPSALERTGRYDACSYEWKTDTWGGWTSTCSDNSIRTRRVWCQRADGAPVGDNFCTLDERPISSETSGQYGSCTYKWSSTNWGPFDSQCSMTANRTGPAVCVRSDGSVVEESYCSTANPGTVTDTRPNYEGCGYVWMHNQGTTSTPAHCAGTVSATVSRICSPQDKSEIVANALCTEAGLGSHPGSSAITMPCEIVPGPKFTSISSGSHNTLDILNWRAYAGSYSLEAAKTIALELCNSTFDFNLNASACLFRHYYNETTNQTIIAAGQRKAYAGRLPIEGFTQVDVGTGSMVKVPTRVNISEIIDNGWNGANYAQCGRTVSVRAPGGFTYSTEYQCVQ